MGTGPPPAGALAAVVVVTFNRAAYLEQMLASLLEAHGRDPANRRARLMLLLQCTSWGRTPTACILLVPPLMSHSQPLPHSAAS